MTGRIRLPRRTFLKDTVAAGSALAAGPLLATAASPAKWDRETDVLIIGSGIAGMCAAIEAADAGARVMLLEKDAQPYGAAKFSGGHMSAAGTNVQARNHIEDKPDWLYEAMMRDSEMKAAPELVRKYADDSAAHIQWFEDLGVKFADFFLMAGVDEIKEGVGRGHQIAKSPDYPGGPHRGGLGVMLMLTKAAEKRGVSPMLQHTMTSILKAEGGGPVVGVEAQAEGKKVAILAKRAVLIATGGWSGNLEMCLAEDPRLTPDIYPDCWPYHLCLGEGHIAALDVGAELSNMSYGGYLPVRWGSRVYQIWEPQTFDSIPNINTGVSIVDFQRVILVKSDGKRYINEMLGSTPVSLPAYRSISATPDNFPAHPFNEAYLNLSDRPRNVWAVTDADGAERLGWLLHKAQILNPDPKSGIALYPGMVTVSENLKDLAEKMKVNSVGLEATLARYNQFVENGKDADFGKPAPTNKIVAAPFYAVKMAMLKHTRRNGIRVNTRGQVLDRSGLSLTRDIQSDAVSIDSENVIPRLYAAGECANYLGCYHTHGTLGIYSYFGRVAGKNATRETPLA